MLLAGKSIIVTGASRGIGRAIAIACAEHGADVALNYWRDNDATYGKQGAVDEVAEAVTALGRRVIAVEGDISDPAIGTRLVEKTVEAFGRVDVLASNAGICPFHAFLDLPPETLRQTLAVNLEGAFYVVQAAARQDAAPRPGRRHHCHQLDQRVGRRRHAGLPQVLGSSGYRPRWAWIVGWPEFLSKGRTESAIIDSATDLKQQVGATSRPPHLLRFVHTAVHQEIGRPFGNRSANSQSCPVPLGVIDQPVALAGKITI
jgi:NAD(P)-dependent dehydrogenase (short-subunit alcohol dehydrogenase family)